MKQTNPKPIVLIVILVAVAVIIGAIFFMNKNSEPVYYVYGKYQSYDVTSSITDSVVARCSAITVYGGDEYIITKYRDRVKNGNTVNQIDGNGQLLLNIRLNGLNKDELRILTGTSTALLGVRRSNVPIEDGFYCASFVDVVSVEPYIAQTSTQ